MSWEEHEQRPLTDLADALVGAQEVDRELVRDALAELEQEGRISYMGARERRLRRERAVAAQHRLG